MSQGALVAMPACRYQVWASATNTQPLYLLISRRTFFSTPFCNTTSLILYTVHTQHYLSYTVHCTYPTLPLLYCTLYISNTTSLILYTVHIQHYWSSTCRPEITLPWRCSWVVIYPDRFLGGNGRMFLSNMFLGNMFLSNSYCWRLLCLAFLQLCYLHIQGEKNFTLVPYSISVVCFFTGTLLVWTGQYGVIIWYYNTPAYDC